MDVSVDGFVAVDSFTNKIILAGEEGKGWRWMLGSLYQYKR